MRITSFALLTVLSGVIIGLPGCVTEDQYVDTATAPQETWVYGTSPVGFRNQPELRPGNAPGRPGPIIEIRNDDDELAGDVDVDARLDADDEVGGVLGYVSPVRYRVSVDRRIDALTREMNHTISWAESKGAPGRAALDPHLRDFRMSIEQAENRIAMPSENLAVDSAEAQDIEYHLNKADQAILDARRELTNLPAPE